MTRRVYMDHAATTPCDPQVVEVMLPYFQQHYGNPSGVHAEGRATRRAVDQARDEVAALLGADSSQEIIFTGSGSEADNIALYGVAHALKERGQGRHIVTTSFEHHAVLHTAQALEEQGFSVTYVDPNADGIIEPAAIEAVLQDDTILVSVMLANNEIGTIQPVQAIADLCRERNICVHTDAVQAVGHIPVNVEGLGVDLLSLSAHKFYGPKGIGALYVRHGVPLVPHTHGGGQEMERRAGTENVPAIVGLAKALQLADESLETNMQLLTALRDQLIDTVLQTIPSASLNGHRTQRLPGNAHFSFSHIDGESLLVNLDMRGVAASSGSACSAGSVEPSYVLSAMGLPREEAAQALRLTLGRSTTEEDIQFVVQALQQCIAALQTT